MGTDGQIFTYTDERAYYFASGYKSKATAEVPE